MTRKSLIPDPVITEPITNRTDGASQRVAWCAACSCPIAYGEGVSVGVLGRIYCRECAADTAERAHE